MSYDYDSLVKKALDFRRLGLDGKNTESKDAVDLSQEAQSSAMSTIEALQGAMGAFEELSQHCPMTPLLWIFYGATAFDYCQELAKTSASNTEDGQNSFDPLVASVSSMETEVQILQLGLQEFPGSLLLHLRHVFLLEKVQKIPQSLPQPPEHDLKSAQEQAIDSVGCGSYSGEEGTVVVSFFYTPLAKLYASENNKEALFKLLVSDQPRRPLPNDEVLQLYLNICDDHGIFPREGEEENPEQIVAHSRRLVAKLFNGIVQLQHFEAEIQALLYSKQLLPPWRMLQDQFTDSMGSEESSVDEKFWNAILSRKSESTLQFGMGYGDIELAKCFVSFASCLANTKEKVSSENEQAEYDKERWRQMVQDAVNMSAAVYERGVAECPTVETIWISYLDHLQSLVKLHFQQKKTGPGEGTMASPQQLVAVAQRACRNCPYSLSLAQRQLVIQGFLAEYNVIVLDPDKLFLEMAQPALASKFLPPEHATGTLYLTILRVIQQRILSLLVSFLDSDVLVFDMALDPDKTEKMLQKQLKHTESIPDLIWTEVQDLCQDWIDLCTTMEEELVKSNAKTAAMTRSVLFEQRAVSMEHVIKPLSTISPSIPNDKPPNNDEDENLRLLHKAVKLQNPSHPDTQLAYIRRVFVGTSAAVPITNPVDVPLRLCHVRFLFSKAVTLSGSASQRNALFARDHQSAFKQLADEWIMFETQFGSPHSLQEAQAQVDRKISKFQASGRTGLALPGGADNMFANKQNQSVGISELATKNELENKNPEEEIQSTDANALELQSDIDSGHVSKKARTALRGNDDGSAERDSPNQTMGALSEAKCGHKVKVADLEYPAHPFTIRVYNLADNVNDMDLVDKFQNSKCGRLVYARIVRDKKGKSKGWGLVQFEERDDAERALKLDGVVGIKERIISVERSHTPAVPSIVPPGMHRVNPQGGGKASKRNLKRKAQWSVNKTQHVDAAASNQAEEHEKQYNFTALDLVPRGIRKAFH